MNNTNQIIENYFGGYAAAVAQSRALVSVEDGLKPSMRMAMYANYTDKWIYPKKTGKFIKIVGSASRFCWHGDSSTYGMLIRAAKPFAMRYPLYEAQGSVGTLMDADSHAAPRYVEGRISELGTLFFKNIDKEVVTDWRENYDNTEYYPGLLPSLGFWNICNGTSGIGTGLASSVPQFNIKDMNTALIDMLWGREFKIPLPDFATGGILLNSSEVEKSLREGSGAACKLRARIIYNDKERMFVVKELPYATYTNTICKELETLMDDEESGIESFNDATGMEPDIEIRISKKAKPEDVLTLLFAKTSLQNTFGINLTMLEDGRKPRLYTLPEAMRAHLDHEIVTYTRAFEYDKKKAEERIHILDGYILACADIDEVIRVIKTSKTKEEAAVNLTKSFELDMIQANAILKLTLARIAALEVEKFVREREELLREVERIDAILSDNSLLFKEIESGLRNVITKFGDKRRTELLDIVESETEKLLYFTPSGKACLNPPKNEEVVSTLICGLPYLCITRKGMVYRSTDIPKRAKQVFKLEEGDEIIAVYPDDETKFLVFLDDEKHFRCKEIATLNKIKTSLSLTNLTFVACISQRATKTNYKELCEAEQ